MNPSRIYLSPPHIGAVEQALVREAFESNWIAPLGPHVDAFEDEVGEIAGSAHVCALSSGTSAIHLALTILGVERDDWVLCQSLTFAGTVNPVAYVGATPILIGSEGVSWNMDPDALRDAMKNAIRRGKRPKAIIPVHLYGMPYLVHEIRGIATEYEVPIIEDAAEALGSVFSGNPCGSFGDMALFSFNGNKIITTSGGGALLSNREDWIAKARFLATQARDPAPHYEHSTIGYNYRLSNVLAAIGRGQLRVLGDRVSARRANFDRYRTALSTYSGIDLLDERSPEVFSNRWLTTITVDPKRTGGATRESIRMALAEANIEARPIWKPMHLQPVFKDAPYFGDGLAEQIFDKGLCLPSGSSLTGADFDRIISVFDAVLR